MPKIRFLPPAVFAAAVAVALGGCDAGGYYRTAAEAECRTRGVAPQSAAFRDCVKTLEDAEYRLWARSVPGH